jgi:hypothetical protein
LLGATGGIWTDASVLPIGPLRAWLPELLAPSGFFAFSAPGPDRLLSSWFIAAERGNPAVLAWRDAVDAYWHKPRIVVGDPRLSENAPPQEAGLDPDLDTCPYFWFHYLFAEILRRSVPAAAVWARTPEIDARPMHAAQAALRTASPSLHDFLRAAALGPLQKLDWRLSLPPDFVAHLPGGAAAANRDRRSGRP